MAIVDGTMSASTRLSSSGCRYSVSRCRRPCRVSELADDGVWSIFRLTTPRSPTENMDPTPLPSDATTTVAELRQLVADFVAERDWSQFHSPKNVSMALAIEAAELM